MPHGSSADSITLLRGYGAQLWVFVQDLSQLKAVYPRWQSFLASTSQQFFATADYDTAQSFPGFAAQNEAEFVGCAGRKSSVASEKRHAIIWRMRFKGGLFFVLISASDGFCLPSGLSGEVRPAFWS